MHRAHEGADGANRSARPRSAAARLRRPKAQVLIGKGPSPGLHPTGAQIAQHSPPNALDGRCPLSPVRPTFWPGVRALISTSSAACVSSRPAFTYTPSAPTHPPPSRPAAAASRSHTPAAMAPSGGRVKPATRGRRTVLVPVVQLNCRGLPYLLHIPAAAAPVVRQAAFGRPHKAVTSSSNHAWMNRWICARPHTSSRSEMGLDGDPGVVVFAPWRCLLSSPGLDPIGLVTHEDTPPFPYFHTVWLYLRDHGLVGAGPRHSHLTRDDPLRAVPLALWAEDLLWHRKYACPARLAGQG
jgi:hypothetical protein